MILRDGFSQDLIANFDVKDLIRHGLLMEDYSVRLQLINMTNTSTDSKNYFGQRNRSSLNTLTQRKTVQQKTSPAGSRSPASSVPDLTTVQREFMLKRKKAEDNIDRYERENQARSFMMGGGDS